MNYADFGFAFLLYKGIVYFRMNKRYPKFVGN